MLLALLRLVAGRLGGPLGGPLGSPPPPMLMLDALLIIGGGAPNSPGEGLELFCRGGAPPGGALARPPSPSGGGAPSAALDENERGGIDFGGGGVPGPAPGVWPAGFDAPLSFLLIHLLRSGSYTKLLASPRLARTALGCWGSMESFLAPPNQPPKPQPPFFACFSAARLAVVAVSYDPGRFGKRDAYHLPLPPGGPVPHSPDPSRIWPSP